VGENLSKVKGYKNLSENFLDKKICFVKSIPGVDPRYQSLVAATTPNVSVDRKGDSQLLLRYFSQVNVVGPML
jgi:hypothetical protein